MMRTKLLSALESQAETQALESIDYQDLDFFNDLVGAFTDLKKLSKQELSSPEAGQLLAGVIKNHTGMTIIPVLAELGPSVFVPRVSRNNPLINDYIRSQIPNADGVKLINETKGFSRGSVNLQTGRVSGVFAELEVEIYFPEWVIKSSQFSAEECAAAILHELGHIFVYFECLVRTVRTNQVLAGVTRALDGSASQKERETIILSAKQALSLKTLDISELSRVTNSKVVEAVVVSSLIEESRSELGSNIYDANNFEFLADQYAARHGAGRHMVTFFDKIHKSSKDMSTRSLSKYLYMEVIKSALLVGTVAFLPTVAGPIIGAIYLLMVANDNQWDTEYDRPLIRVKRIRNEMIEAQKNPKIPPAQLKEMLEDVKVIDGLLADMNDRLQWFDLVLRYMSPSFRNRIDAEVLQQQLESLVANDLFSRAAELKTLA